MIFYQKLCLSLTLVVLSPSRGFAHSPSSNEEVPPALAVQVVAVGQPSVVKTIFEKASKNEQGEILPGGASIVPRDLDTLPPGPLYLAKNKKDKEYTARLFSVPGAPGSTAIIAKQEVVTIKYTPLNSDNVSYGKKTKLLQKTITPDVSRLTLFLVKEKGTSKWNRFDRHLLDTSPKKCPAGSFTVLNFSNYPIDLKFRDQTVMSLRPNQHKTYQSKKVTRERVLARAAINGKAVKLLPMVMTSRKGMASFLVFYHLERPINKLPIAYTQYSAKAEIPELPPHSPSEVE